MSFLLCSESDFLQVCLNFCLCSCSVFTDCFINISLNHIRKTGITFFSSDISSKQSESSCRRCCSSSTSRNIRRNFLNCVNVSNHRCSVECQSIVMSWIQSRKTDRRSVSSHVFKQVIEIYLWICLIESDSSNNFWTYIWICNHHWVVCASWISSRLAKTHNREICRKCFSTIHSRNNSFQILIVVSTSFDDSICIVLNSIVRCCVIVCWFVNESSSWLVEIQIISCICIHDVCRKFGCNTLTLHNNYCWTLLKSLFCFFIIVWKICSRPRTKFKNCSCKFDVRKSEIWLCSIASQKSHWKICCICEVRCSTSIHSLNKISVHIFFDCSSFDCESIVDSLIVRNWDCVCCCLSWTSISKECKQCTCRTESTNDSSASIVVLIWKNSSINWLTSFAEKSQIHSQRLWCDDCTWTIYSVVASIEVKNSLSRSQCFIACCSISCCIVSILFIIYNWIRIIWINFEVCNCIWRRLSVKWRCDIFTLHINYCARNHEKPCIFSKNFSHSSSVIIIQSHLYDKIKKCQTNKRKKLFNVFSQKNRKKHVMNLKNVQELFQIHILQRLW